MVSPSQPFFGPPSDKLASCPSARASAKLLDSAGVDFEVTALQVRYQGLGEEHPVGFL